MWMDGQTDGEKFNTPLSSLQMRKMSKVDNLNTLSQRIKRMELEFQLEFAALVFQSHSEIMLNMIKTIQKNKLIVLIFLRNASKLVCPSSMVTNL